MSAVPAIGAMCVTPFGTDGRIDEPALATLVDRIAASGTTVYLGSYGSGEGHLLRGEHDEAGATQRRPRRGQVWSVVSVRSAGQYPDASATSAVPSIPWLRWLPTGQYITQVPACSKV